MTEALGLVLVQIIFTSSLNDSQVELKLPGVLAWRLAQESGKKAKLVGEKGSLKGLHQGL